MAWPRKCKTYVCKNPSTYGFKWCAACYKRRQYRQKKGTANQSFSNKTMRVPCEGKPHIQLIRDWWRVSPVPKDNPTNPHWQAAHTLIYRLNEQRHKR
jgi:hypothetical protein